MGVGGTLQFRENEGNKREEEKRRRRMRRMRTSWVIENEGEGGGMLTETVSVV